MLPPLLRIIFCMLLLTASYRPLLASTQVLDLSQPSRGFDNPVQVSKGLLTVEIINKVPAASYRVTWEIGTRLLPPLPVAPLADSLLLPAECSDVKAPLAELDAAKSEQEVAAAVPLLRTALQDCTSNSALIKQAEEALAATTQRIEVELGYESELRIEVVRFGVTPAQAGVTKWESAYRTPDSGQWFVSYGFTFIPNNDNLFFSQPVAGQAGKYKVTEKFDNRDNDFAPAIFYAWMPERFRTTYGSFSLAGGLGFDLSNPVVFLGPAVTIRHNLTLVAGAVMHKEKRLNGKYSLGEEIGENLSEDQLKEETYRPAWFVGLSFRFDSAPSTHKKAPTAPAANSNATGGGQIVGNNGG